MQANIQTQGMSDTKAYALLTLHTLSLYREHKLSLEKSCRNSLKSQGTFLWQGTYNYSYSHRTTQLCFWRQPMKTRTLKGRLCHQIFSSQTYTCLYNGPFTYQSVKSILRRVRHTWGIYIVIGSFMASKPHRLELNLKICLLTSFEESLIFQRMLCLLGTNGWARESGCTVVTKRG